MLQTLLAYGNGAGIENRWLVIDGDPEFFAITKRLHNRLHGADGDGGPLGEREHAHYEEVLADNLAELTSRVSSARPGDAPRPADRRPARRAPRQRDPGDLALPRRPRRSATTTPTQAWAFLRPYVEDADAFVFSRRVYAPRWVDGSRLVVIPPSIDPFSAKNAALDPADVATVLARAGLVSRRRSRRPGALHAPRRYGGLGARPCRDGGTRGRRAGAAPRRATGGPGESLGPAQGHGRRDGRLRPPRRRRLARRHPPDARRARRSRA